MAKRGTLYRCHLFSYGGPQTEGITSQWTKNLQPISDREVRSGELIEMLVKITNGALRLNENTKVRFDILEEDHLLTGGLDDRIVSYVGTLAGNPTESFPSIRKKKTHFESEWGMIGLQQTVKSFKQSHITDWFDHILIVEESFAGTTKYYVLTWWMAERLEDFLNSEFYFIVNVDDAFEDQSEEILGVTETPADPVEVWPVGNPEQQGPFSVGRTIYTAPSFTIPGGLEGWPLDINVTMEALVRYPADRDGNNVPFSTKKSKYPLVILAHGRHTPFEFERNPDGSLRIVAGSPVPVTDSAGNVVEFKNYEGLEYLAAHLASHGFIAVSINLNGRFDPATAEGELVSPASSFVSCRPFVADQAAIAHRGLTILRHIRELGSKNSADPFFQNKIDLDKIALIGHSRGGEAVVNAYDINKGLPAADRANIKALVSIAPTDFRNITLDVPYLVFIGSDDGDVADLQGLRLYDRAQPPKQMIWIVGAIHNYFSSNWHWQDEVLAAPPVTRLQHQDIAKGYCNAFLQQYVNNLFFHKTPNGIEKIQSFFTGERMLNALQGTGVEIHHASQLLGALVVDSFEDVPPDRGLNSLGESVITSDIATFDELDLHNLTSVCGTNLPNWFHDTHGLRLEWSVITARYTTALGSRSVLNYDHLSFRVGQDNLVGAPQDFKVRITDSSGKDAVLKISDFGRIARPRTKTLSSGAMTMSVLSSIRLSLDKFKEANPALNLGVLASISFEFSERPAGKLVFDNIEFSV